MVALSAPVLGGCGPDGQQPFLRKISQTRPCAYHGRVTQALAASHELNRRLLHFRTHPCEEEAITLAQALLSDNRLGAARAVLARAQPEEGERASLLLLEAQAWLQEGDLERALEKFLRAAVLEPACAPAFLGLGQVLHARRDLLRAKVALERACSLESACEEAQRLLAEVNQDLAGQSLADAEDLVGHLASGGPPTSGIQLRFEEAIADLHEAQPEDIGDTSESAQAAPSDPPAQEQAWLEIVSEVEELSLGLGAEEQGVAEVLHVDLHVVASNEPEQESRWAIATERPPAPVEMEVSPSLEEVLVDVEPSRPLEPLADAQDDDVRTHELEHEAQDFPDEDEQEEVRAPFALPPSGHSSSQWSTPPLNEIHQARASALDLAGTPSSLRPFERHLYVARKPRRKVRSLVMAGALCGASLGYLALQFVAPTNAPRSRKKDASEPVAVVASSPHAPKALGASMVVPRTPEVNANADVEASAGDEALTRGNDEILARVESELAAGRAAVALELLEPLRQEQERSVRMLGLLGRALYNTDRVDAAAGAYELALSMAPDDVVALLGRAEVHLRAGRFEDAFGLLSRAKPQLEANAKVKSNVHTWMLTLFGHAYLQRRASGDRELAEAALTQVIASAHPDPEAYFWLGESLSGRSTPEAKAAYAAYLERAPKGRYAKRAHRALRPLL